MPKGIAAALAALVLAAGLTGCGTSVRAGQSLGVPALAQPGAKATGVSASGKASNWKLADLEAAEGRKIHAETHYGDTTITADLSAQEQALLERLLLMPPGASLKDGDLTPSHLKRAHQQSEFVYRLDGRFHRTIWQMKDARSGKVVGYRIHSQPRDLLSGKYIIAFYGPDTRLLMAQPVWY